MFSHRNAITTTHQVENQLGYSVRNMWTASRKPWCENTPALNVAGHEYSHISHTCINVHNTIRISPDTAKPRPHKHTRIQFNVSDFHEQPILFILIDTNLASYHICTETLAFQGNRSHSSSITPHYTSHHSLSMCTGWFIAAVQLV